MMDAYTTLPWEPLCGAVACLKVSLLEGRVVPLRAAVGAWKAAERRAFTPRLLQSCYSRGASKTKPPQPSRVAGARTGGV